MRALGLGEVGAIYLAGAGYFVFRVVEVAGAGRMVYGNVGSVNPGQVLRVTSVSLTRDSTRVALIPSEHKKYFLHAEFRTYPQLEAGLEVPSGVKQFDYGPLLVADDTSTFGWRAEPIETVILPELSYSLVFRNQLGVAVNPLLVWEYAWYRWEPVREPDVAYRAITDPKAPRWLLYGTRPVKYDYQMYLGVRELIPLGASYEDVARIVSGW